MRAGGNADADAVGLEFLRPRKARHGQFCLGQRQRGQIGIAAHVGDDAGDDGGLPRLVLADRGVLCQHMRHLVRQHRGQFRGVAGQRDQAARDIELSGRQREGVDRAGIEDGHLVGEVGTVGGRHQPVDGLGDQRFQPRVVIGAAIGRQDALMLALGRGRLRHRAGRFCGGRRGGRGGLEPADIAAAGKAQSAAQQQAGHNAAAAKNPAPSQTPSFGRHLPLPSRPSSRRPSQSAPPGPPRSAARRAPRSSRGPEFACFRGILRRFPQPRKPASRVLK